MLNDSSEYYRTGALCALARARGDEACAQFHKDWLNAAIALESPEDKPKARNLFDTGYRMHRWRA